VSTIEELLGKESSGSGLESRDYGRKIRHADHVAPSSPTSTGRSVGMIRSRTQAMEFSFSFSLLWTARSDMTKISAIAYYVL
jgi:hypothetical protein